MKGHAKQPAVAQPAVAPVRYQTPRIDTPIPDTSHLSRTPATPSVAADPGALLGDGDKRAFLTALRGAITDATSRELAGTGWSADQCPYIEYWFAYYEHRRHRRGSRDRPQAKGHQHSGDL